MPKTSPKTVLVVSYLYPPSREVGAQRVAGFVEHLPVFGWQAIIVTSRDGWTPNATDPAHISRTSPMILERIMDWFRRTGKQVGPYKFSAETGIVQSTNSLGLFLGRMAIVWLRGWWAVKAIPLCYRLAQQHQPQIIYVNCGPFGQTLTGLVLKVLLHRPLVLDFRDAWSLDPYGQFSWVSRSWVRLWERLSFHMSNLLIVTSPSARSAYQKRYPSLAGKIILIYNGYDETLFHGLNPNGPPYPSIAIGYAGTAYPKRIGVIFKAIRDLPEVNLHLYGRIFEPASFWQLAQEYHLSERIIYHGYLARRELLTELLRCQILLVTQDYAAQSVVTPIAGKTFDYLRLDKPILGLVPAGDNATVLSISSKVAVVTTPSAVQIQKAIYQLIDRADSSRAQAQIAQFSRQKLTGQLATLFDQLAD